MTASDSAKARAAEAPPWLRYYGAVLPSLAYPDGSLSDAVLAAASRTPDAPALSFLGATTSYRQLDQDIHRCAAAFASLGVRRGDRVAIVLPTCPQGVIAVYAANRLGAVAVMVHPLSTGPEVDAYVSASHARLAVTLNLCYPRVRAARGLERIIVTRIPDTLGTLARLWYRLRWGLRTPAVPRDPGVSWWRALMARSGTAETSPAGRPDDLAAILFSGGTTGTPKGVMLSNRNLVAEGMEAAAWVGLGPGDSMLAALPLFHGVGLGLCVNSVLLSGGKSILVPIFSPENVAKAIRKERPTLMVGVPTLYDSLTRDRSLAAADLSSLRAAFSGADTLPGPVKDRFERLVAARGGSVKLLEGYGLTEAVTAIMAMPLGEHREGSVGVPFPDVRGAICRPGTTEELPAGEEGEVCVAGPAVMMGYLNDPEATALTLRPHPDGRTWLHTGDLGRRDEDGFFFFTVRLKRMIKSSGFNVYPGQVEEVLYQHPAVAEACVIGIPDPSQGERVVACVVARAGVAAGPELERELIAFCRERLIKWSCPRAVTFRRDLPKTRLAKIDYRALVREVMDAEAGRVD